MQRPAVFRSLIAPSLLIFAITLSSPAFAQSSKNDKAAEARNDDGKRAFDRADFEAARRAFADAYGLSPKPKYLKNLGAAELNLNRPLEALRHFKQFMKEPGTSHNFVEQVKPLQEQAMARTGHLAVEAPAGTKVSIDDTDTGEQTPLKDPIDVTAGSHKVQGSYEGKTANASAQAEPGKVTVVRLSFESRDTPPPSAAGQRENTSNPPSQGAPPPPTPRSEAPGGWSGAKLGTVIGLGSVAVVSLGLAAGFGIAKSNAADGANSLRGKLGADGCSGATTSPDCVDLRDKNDSAKTNATRANVLLGAGVGFAVLAGAAAIFWPNRSKETAFAPLISPHTVGAQGAFHF